MFCNILVTWGTILFNDVSTFQDHLMPKPFMEKNINGTI